MNTKIKRLIFFDVGMAALCTVMYCSSLLVGLSLKEAALITMLMLLVFMVTCTLIYGLKVTITATLTTISAAFAAITLSAIALGIFSTIICIVVAGLLTTAMNNSSRRFIAEEPKVKYRTVIPSLFVGLILFSGLIWAGSMFLGK